MKLHSKYFLIVLGFLFLPFLGTAQSYIYATKDGAIKGYDPVAYFTDKKPVKGSKEFTYVWKGALWHFASQKNLDAFKENPEKYAPQYGGYCAYGLAKGKRYKIEPEAWDIVDGKLYLNYDLGVQRTWREDRENYIAQANKNWPAPKKK